MGKHNFQKELLNTTRVSNRMTFILHNYLRIRKHLNYHLRTSRGELHSKLPHLIGSLKHTHILKEHTSCVNYVKWRRDGTLLASGGDDKHLVITKYPELTTKTIITTGHVANIFCVGFVPTSPHLAVTCSGDHQIRLFDIEREKCISIFEGHQGRVKKFIMPFTQCSSSLYSCSDDGTMRHWDIKARPFTKYDPKINNSPFVYNQYSLSSLNDDYMNSILQQDDIYGSESNVVATFEDTESKRPQPIASIAMSEERQEYVIIGGHSPSIWLLDCRMMSNGPRTEPVAQFKPSGRHQCTRVTGVSISYNASRVMGSWSGEHIYQFNVLTSKDNDTESYFNSMSDSLNHNIHVKRNDNLNPFDSSLNNEHNYLETDSNINKTNTLIETPPSFHKRFTTVFKGHCNTHTVKDVQYMGPFSNWVASGSNDGRFFIWDAHTGHLCFIGHEADSSIVNSLSEHPEYSAIATSGIDSYVKIWHRHGIVHTLNHCSDVVKTLTKNNEISRRNSSRLSRGRIRRITFERDGMSFD